MFRVSVIEVREVLRAWLAGMGLAEWPPWLGWIARLPAGMWPRRWLLG